MEKSEKKTYTLKSFIVENLWAILSFIVWIIVAWTVTTSAVKSTAGDLAHLQQVHAQDVKDINDKIDDLEQINGQILQRLSSIETKLDLLLNDKIKNK